MRRIGILYFSATGGTRVVAELLAELLARDRPLDGGEAPRDPPSLASIEEEGARAVADAAELLVLCFPTYYLKPAPPMRDFAATLGPFDPPKPCYLVTTCELYSENSARRMARAILPRGLAPAGWKALRAPGSDVTAVLPAGLVPWLYRFGRGFEASLDAAAAEIAAAASAASAPARGTGAGLPPARPYTPLTQLLQVALLDRFDQVRFRLRALGDRCTDCGACVALCPVGAIAAGGSGPRFGPESCILCCRCVHGCPERAIVLFEGLKDNRRIDAGLLAELKERARIGLGLGEERRQP